MWEQSNGFLRLPNEAIEAFGFTDELLAFAELLHGSFPTRKTSTSVRYLKKRWRWGTDRALAFITALARLGFLATGEQKREQKREQPKLDFTRLYETSGNSPGNSPGNRQPKKVTDEPARAPVSLEDIKKIEEQDSSPPASPPAIDAQPGPEQLIEQYNAFANTIGATKTLPWARWSDTRRKKLKARIEDDFCGHGFRTLLVTCYRSKFIRQAHERKEANWFDVEWLLSPGNIQKVMEGKYANGWQDKAANTRAVGRGFAGLINDAGAPGTSDGGDEGVGDADR